jgi:hypothetical protein
MSARSDRSSTGARVPRCVAVPGVLWGAVMLARPGDLTRAVCGGGREPAAWIVRVLGARLVAQNVVVLAHPTRAVVLAGVGADALHAASMVLARVRWPEHARAIRVSGTTSAVSALVGGLTAPVAGR